MRNFLYLPVEKAHFSEKGGRTMETATEIVANETEIKQAMGVLGLGSLVDNLLDEIELDRELTLSIEEADRGEKVSLEEAERIVEQKFASGYYDR
jgi:hypothetical protein